MTPVRIETRGQARKRCKRLRGQRGAGHQPQRQRQLAGHQRAACSTHAAAASHAQARLADDLAGVHARGPPGWCGPKQQRRPKRQRERDAEHSPVDGEAIDAGHVARDEAADQADRPGRDQHAGATAQKPQHDTLAKQLQGKPPARRPHRGPNGQLTFAVHATRQEEIGDIGARNQQQAGDGGHQQTQRRPRLAINLVGQRHDLRAQSTARRLFARQSCRDHLEIGARRLERDPALHASDEFEHAQVGGALGQTRRRNPDVDIARQHARRHHADDGGWAAPDVDVATDQRVLTAVLAAPEAVADEHARAGGVGSLALPEVAPALWPHAQRAEEPGGNERRLDLHGLAAPGEVHPQVGGRHRGELLEHRGAISERVKLAVRELDDGGALPEVGLPDHHQPVRFAKRQRREQHRLHRRVDRRRGADRQADRRDRGQRQGRTEAQAVNNVAERC